MKFFLLSIVTWVSGLLTFLAGAVLLNWGAAHFLGRVIFLSVIAAAATIAIVYFPAMLVLRASKQWSSIHPYIRAGAVIGLLPGVALGLFAAAVANIDGPATTALSLLTTAPGLLGVAAGLISGAVFGAGFFRTFAERQ